jgi:hypothetical protein
VTDSFCFYLAQEMPVCSVTDMFSSLGSYFDQAQTSGSSEKTVVMVLQIIAVVGFLVVGIQIQRHWKALCCPFCKRPGVGKRHRTKGVAVQCLGCGEIIDSGMPDRPSQPDHDGVLTAHRQSLPVRRIELRSPWVWLLFLLSVLSAVCGAVIHSFGLVTVLVPLWSILVASRLIQTLQSGCMNGYWALTFRERQPVKFWLLIGVWFLAYGFALYLPLGFGLHARMKTSPPAPAETKP